jgi:hypothetical protein
VQGISARSAVPEGTATRSIASPFSPFRRLAHRRMLSTHHQRKASTALGQGHEDVARADRVEETRVIEIGLQLVLHPGERQHGLATPQLASRPAIPSAAVLPMSTFALALSRTHRGGSGSALSAARARRRKCSAIGEAERGRSGARAVLGDRAGVR